MLRRSTLQRMSAVIPAIHSNHSCVPSDQNTVKLLGQIQKALAGLDGNAAMAELKANGVLALTDSQRSM